MLDEISFGYKYGRFIKSFSNGDVVIACQPNGKWEIAITSTEQSFPIRTLEKDGKRIQKDLPDAESMAKYIADEIEMRYGELPAYLICN